MVDVDADTDLVYGVPINPEKLSRLVSKIVIARWLSVDSGTYGLNNDTSHGLDLVMCELELQHAAVTLERHC